MPPGDDSKLVDGCSRSRAGGDNRRSRSRDRRESRSRSRSRDVNHRRRSRSREHHQDERGRSPRFNRNDKRGSTGHSGRGNVFHRTIDASPRGEGVGRPDKKNNKSEATGRAALQKCRSPLQDAPQGRRPDGFQSARQSLVKKPRYHTIDRTRVCPLLLRLFYKFNGNHELTDFAARRQEPADDELQIYTWKDVSLDEPCDVVKNNVPRAQAVAPNAKFAFKLICRDSAGQITMKNMGTVDAGKAGPDDRKTLQHFQFEAGDFISLSIQA